MRRDFLLVDSPLTPVIMGHPWLTLRNLHIDWRSNSVFFGVNVVMLFVLCQLVRLCLVLFSRGSWWICQTCPRSTWTWRKCPVSLGLLLSLHTVPMTVLSIYCQVSLYSLSAPEGEAMDKYISDSLVAGLIRPSSSPAGARFFFVEKKNGSLQPSIDYRGLKSITVRNTYPLSLMSSAFEQLQGASFFTKLDLRNAYHLVRIRENCLYYPQGHFEYRVMPFGLSDSPAVFPALVNDVLRDMVD